MGETIKVVALVQARLGSRRLPSKVLLPLAGKPSLEHTLIRLTHCERLHDIVVITSTDTTDDPLASWCEAKHQKCFRGSLEDVLDRYYQASTFYKADVIVRITGDCPLIDPCIVDEVVDGFFTDNYDAYSLVGEFPDGLDCQVFSYWALAKAWTEATLPSEREHVGAFIENSHPELFKIGGLKKFVGLAHHRWVLDELSDYMLLQTIYNRLYRENALFLTDDVLSLMDKEPGLLALNAGIIRNEGYQISVKADGAL